MTVKWSDFPNLEEIEGQGEADCANLPEVGTDGLSLTGQLPRRWEEIVVKFAWVKDVWNDTTYPTKNFPSPSEHAYKLMLMCGRFGFTKAEAADVHIAHYERLGRKHDGEGHKLPRALRAWEMGLQGKKERDMERAAIQEEKNIPAPVVKPQTESTLAAIAGAAKPSAQGDASAGLLSVGADEFLAGEIKPVEWAIKDIWPAGCSGIIGGPEKVGKTWLAHEIVISLATGSSFLGKYPVKRPFRVLYWEEEDSKVRTHRRGNQLVIGRGRNNPSSEYLRYLVGHGLKVDNRHTLDTLTREIDRYRPDFVVAGNLRELHSKDENRPEMAQVRDALRDLSRRYGCAFIIIHHFRKAQSEQNKKGSQMLAGSGVWGAWIEAWLWVNEASSEDIALCQFGSKDAAGIGNVTVQRRDRTDLDPLAQDEDGNAVWPVILADVGSKGLADENRDRIKTLGDALYQETGKAFIIDDLAEKCSMTKRTVQGHVYELVRKQYWAEVHVPGKRGQPRKAYIPWLDKGDSGQDSLPGQDAAFPGS